MQNGICTYVDSIIYLINNNYNYIFSFMQGSCNKIQAILINLLISINFYSLKYIKIICNRKHKYYYVELIVHNFINILNYVKYNLCYLKIDK